MKSVQKAAFALLVAASVSIASCGGPNDNKGSMSQGNSNGEGAVDSSRLTNFDSTTSHGSDSNSIK